MVTTKRKKKSNQKLFLHCKEGEREQTKFSFGRTKELRFRSCKPTPGHLSEENHNSKRQCTVMFTAALFTIGKAWKQSKCPATEEWIKNTWYIYTRISDCPTLCDATDYTVRGIFQARILEWVAFPFSRGFSQPRDQTQVSCIAGRFFNKWAIREARMKY